MNKELRQRYTIESVGIGKSRDKETLTLNYRFGNRTITNYDIEFHSKEQLQNFLILAEEALKDIS